MARTTATEVKQIIETTLADAAVDTFITAANLFVTDELVGKGLSDERLEEIERWLTAHFMACSIEKQTKSEAVSGAVSESYEGSFDTGFNFTRYGQMCMTLDTSGTLRSLNDNGGPAKFTLRAF